MLKKYLTEQEQKLLLSTPKKYQDAIARRDHAWMNVLILTGFRIKEFSLMTVNDALAALRLGYIYLPRQNRKGQAADLTKLVTQPLHDALTDLLDIRREMGYLNTNGDEPLVMSRKHTAMTIRAYQKRVEHWAREAGIAGNVSPHWFRHTRAKNIIRRSSAKNSLLIVQQDLGHVSIKSSAIYSQIDKEQLMDALNEVDGVKPLRKRQVAKLHGVVA